mgnify:CR=1 FL=1
MHKPFIRMLSAVAAFLLTTMTAMLPTPDANADSQALMDEMLETYMNVTPGQVLETQRRGGITFGSVYARSRVVRPNFIAIQPPSFRGGCQGFDLIGGSFSFLNGEQLQQFLRSIASNALNYAFTLALEGVCPTCMQKMEKLRDWSEAINGKLMDSCHWGEALVNSTNLDEWHRSQYERAKNSQTRSGVVDDAFQALENFVSPFLADQSTGELTSQNVVMAALQRSNLQSWFGAIGDQELMEVAMSVTGTIVKRPLNEAGAECTNTEGERDYCIEPLPDILDLEHFINGTDTGPVRIYRCADYPTCLDVTATETNNWPGLKRRIREIMFGPAPTFTGGLVDKFRDPAASFTAAEERFIEGAPIPVMTLLQGVANYDGSLRTMGEQLTEVITVQVARDLMLEIVGYVRKSFGTTGIQMSEVMLKRISEKLNAFSTRVTYEDRQFENMTRLLTLLQQVKKHVREQDPASTVAASRVSSGR